jgi:hypothetical protein
MADQWYGISVGGPMASTTLQVHSACGALIADPRRHEQVCTAPPWEPEPVRIGETHDWEN